MQVKVSNKYILSGPRIENFADSAWISEEALNGFTVFVGIGKKHEKILSRESLICLSE